MRERIESLFHACADGDLERVRTVIAEGNHDIDGGNYWQADIDPRGWSRSPLFIAVMNGQGHVAQWLLQQGAAVDRPSKFGDTPLNALLDDPKPGFWFEAARLLLAHGADVTIPNGEGETPLERMRKHPDDWERIAPFVLATKGRADA